MTLLSLGAGLLLSLLGAGLAFVALECRRKNMHLWLRSYLQRRPSRPSSQPSVRPAQW